MILTRFLQRLCPPVTDSWTEVLRWDAYAAQYGAKYRRDQVREVAREVKVLMDRFHESEERNHFREHVENQFGKGV